MNIDRIHSLVALGVAVISPILVYFQPQIHDFMVANPYIGTVVLALIGIWNNVVEPIHKP